ncbi:MAG TPA: hypothetical protein VFH63_03995 [candidate division Zixibacteria bacterium]|nr:hypothetical protein [candidate division Zixibacteria bacterium]
MLSLQRFEGHPSWATGTTLIGDAEWHYVEIKAIIHDTTGSIEVRLDGSTEITFNGDTRNGGSGVINRLVVMREAAGFSSGDEIRQHDIYVCDSSGSVANNFLGPVRVGALFPSGSGNSTQWTPSAGSNYQTIDEAAPNGDTDYNESTTPGNIDTVAMGNLPVSAAAIYGIQHLTYARKTDAGARTLRQVIRSGGTNFEGPDLTVLDTYKYFLKTYTLDPATNAAWTESGINALEAGYKDQA